MTRLYSNTKTFAFSMISIAGLSACGGTTSGDPSDMDEPIPPSVSITSSQVSDREAFIDTLSVFETTGALAGVNNGVATYNGHWTSDMSFVGDDDIDGIIGTVAMIVDVGGFSYDVSGTVSGLHTLDGDTPLEELDGELTIDGSIGGFSKDFDATTFEGDLTGNFGTDQEIVADFEVDISGGMRDKSGAGNNGSVVGGTTSGTVFLTASTINQFGSMDVQSGDFRADR